MSDTRLPFIGADELRANTPAEPDDWTWSGYLKPGNLTILAKKPKAGGSTFAFAVAEAVACDAGSFLGRSVNGGPVVYVSEEAASTLAHKIPATGSIRILTRDAMWPKPSWPELIAGSREEAKRVGAVALVIDTWPFWAGLARDAEKDAGAAGQAMQLALDAARDELAVLLALHARKGGGEDGEGVRGSGAIAGAADIVLELERCKRPCERALLALSRYPSTPGSLIIERDPATGAWRAIAEGERLDARTLADRQAILAALDGGELTRPELEDATGAPARQWHGTLDALIEEGQVRRSGEGRKGSPYRWAMVRRNAAQAGAHNAQNKPRADAAQAPAQHRAETPVADGLFSAAHPFRDAAETTDAAESLNGAHRAENGNGLPEGMSVEWAEAIAAEHMDLER